MIRSIATEPYKFLLLMAFSCAVISLLGVNQTLDIQLHDTYYVVNVFTLGVLLAGILGAFAYIYWLTKKNKRINWFTEIHVCYTSSIFFLAISLLLISEFVSNVSYTNSSNNTILVIGALTSFALLICQALFIFNIFSGFIRGKARE